MKTRQPKASTTALYRHYDERGRLLYVGVSHSAVLRLTQHVYSPWFEQVVYVKIQHFPSRRSALVAEKKAIRAEKPKYNRRFLDRQFRANPFPNSTRTTLITSISMPKNLYRLAVKKAAGLKWGLSTYIQSLVERDLAARRQEA